MAGPMPNGTAASSKPPLLAKKAVQDGSAPESTDFANYFITYGYLYHQARARTDACHRGLG